MRLARKQLKTVLFSFLLFLALPGTAQVIRGRVIDNYTLKPLYGATISFGSKGTVTGNEGEFTLPAGTEQITVSQVGYQSRVVPVKSSSSRLTIELSPSNVALNEVTVSSASSNKKNLEVPNAISIVTEQDFHRTSGIHLENTINLIPGVHMERRAAAAGTRIVIRGYGNASNFTGSGYKAYLNGIPLTDADGTTLMDDIDFTMIDHAEIIKGPASSLYGSGIGGVVNLHTVKAAPGTRELYQQVMGGSYGLFRTNTAYLSGGNNANIIADYGHQTAAGYRQHSASQKDFITLAGDFYVNEKSTVSLYAGYANTHDELTGETDSTGLYQHPKTADPDYLANNAGIRMESTRFGLTHDYRFSEHFSNATSVFGGSVIIDQPFAAGVTKTNKMKFGGRTVFTAKTEIGKIGLNLVFGGEFLKNFNYGENYALRQDTLRGINSSLEIQTLQYNLFVQADGRLTPTTTLTAGLSENFIEYNIKDMLRFSREYTNAGYYLRFHPVLTPRVGISQRLSPNISVYGNISRGYSPPATNQFTIPQINAVNTQLKPESATSYEIGAKGNLLKQRLNFEVAAFAMTVYDKLVPQSFQAGVSNPAYTITTNAGRVQHNGLETSASYAYQPQRSFLSLIRPFVSYTYSDFTYKDYKSDNNSDAKTVDYSGKKESGVAPNLLNAGFDMEAHAGFYLNATYNYVDKMSLFADDSHYAPRYALVNTKLGFRKVLHQHYSVDLYAGADNIAGITYPSMVFINLAPKFPGQVLQPFLPGEKQSWYGGLSFWYIF